MNQPLRSFAPGSATAEEVRVALASASVSAGSAPATGEMETAVVLGMPHLALMGLSEQWLLKELGHIHWLMLAQAAGRAVPDFATVRGEPVYAAFCALRIRGARFGAAVENGRLTIRSRVGRVSKTQIASLHRLALDGAPAGEVELVSTFVHRTGGGNHTIARFEVPGLPLAAADGFGSELARIAGEHRAGRPVVTDDFATGDLEAPTATARLAERFGPATFSPCPATDFNGAGFLYFASFVAFLDRAEWRADPFAARTASTTDRLVLYTGNLDPGEDLHVTLDDWAAGRPGEFTHRARLAAAATGGALALAFTRKATAA